ncbi:GNAT family N-acetyltransferase [Nocardia blacklockiae]|nr:GNAT family N-acetyltransferase [Nocardia blacklockiae]
MPPVEDAPGWTARRRAAFLDFHRRRTLDPATAVERTWVVDVDGRAVGAARLERQGDAVAAGLWLRREDRGRGIGRQVAVLLLDLARSCGATTFVAETTADNRGALAVLASVGTTLTADGDEVRAALPLDAHPR